jgi:hypothetical protein
VTPRLSTWYVILYDARDVQASLLKIGMLIVPRFGLILVDAVCIRLFNMTWASADRFSFMRITGYCGGG